MAFFETQFLLLDFQGLIFRYRYLRGYKIGFFLQYFNRKLNIFLKFFFTLFLINRKNTNKILTFNHFSLTRRHILELLIQLKLNLHFLVRDSRNSRSDPFYKNLIDQLIGLILKGIFIKTDSMHYLTHYFFYIYFTKGIIRLNINNYFSAYNIIFTYHICLHFKDPSFAKTSTYSLVKNLLLGLVHGFVLFVHLKSEIRVKVLFFLLVHQPSPNRILYFPFRVLQIQMERRRQILRQSKIKGNFQLLRQKRIPLRLVEIHNMLKKHILPFDSFFALIIAKVENFLPRNDQRNRIRRKFFI